MKKRHILYVIKGRFCNTARCLVLENLQYEKKRLSVFLAYGAYRLRGGGASFVVFRTVNNMPDSGADKKEKDEQKQSLNIITVVSKFADENLTLVRVGVSFRVTSVTDKNREQ